MSAVKGQVDHDDVENMKNYGKLVRDEGYNKSKETAAEFREKSLAKGREEADRLCGKAQEGCDNAKQTAAEFYEESLAKGREEADRICKKAMH